MYKESCYSTNYRRKLTTFCPIQLESCRPLIEGGAAEPSILHARSYDPNLPRTVQVSIRNTRLPTFRLTCGLTCNDTLALASVFTSGSAHAVTALGFFHRIHNDVRYLGRSLKRAEGGVLCGPMLRAADPSTVASILILDWLTGAA